MKKYLGLSIGIGITGALWTLISNLLGLIAWPAFAGWTMYFYGGADKNSIIKSLPCLYLGVTLAIITVFLQSYVENVAILYYFLSFLLSFLMTYAQNIKFFQVAPATFLGSFVYFGTGSAFYSYVITTFGCIVMGLFSTTLGGKLDQMISGER